jgi:uncharacterized protein YbdZ (MbtH family)
MTQAELDTLTSTLIAQAELDEAVKTFSSLVSGIAEKMQSDQPEDLHQLVDCINHSEYDWTDLMPHQKALIEEEAVTEPDLLGYPVPAHWVDVTEEITRRVGQKTVKEHIKDLKDELDKTKKELFEVAIQMKNAKAHNEYLVRKIDEIKLAATRAYPTTIGPKIIDLCNAAASYGGQR